MTTEVFSFREGSAYFWTGNATNSALLRYVRNINVTLSSGYHEYRPPYGAYTYVPTGFEGRVDIDQGYMQKDLVKFFRNAAAGTVHAKIIHVIPGAGGSAGFVLWSGAFTQLRFGGMTNDGEQSLSVGAFFRAWTGW